MLFQLTALPFKKISTFTKNSSLINHTSTSITEIKNYETLFTPTMYYDLFILF